MNISIYSFIMAIGWSSILIVIMYLCRRNDFFIKQFGVFPLLLLFCGCMARCLIPIEFPFTKIIPSERIYTAVNTFIETPFVRANSWSTPISIFILLWILITLLLATRKILNYREFVSEFLGLIISSDERVNRISVEVSKELNMKRTAQVICTQAVSVPLGMGFFIKKILLPDMNYSDEQLYYILKHEYTHFKNRDIWIKLLIEVLCIVFWWNPFVYLLKVDLNQTLEIKCDFSVVDTLEKSKRVIYLQTMFDLMKGTNENRLYKSPFITAEFFDVFGKKNMVQRFRLVATYKKQRRNWASVVWVIIMVVTMVLSYSFIFQPKYEAPIEEIITSENAIETTLENTYILKHKDGTYSIVDEHEMAPIKEESVEILSEELEIIEEE